MGSISLQKEDYRDRYVWNGCRLDIKDKGKRDNWQACTLHRVVELGRRIVTDNAVCSSMYLDKYLSDLNLVRQLHFGTIVIFSRYVDREKRGISLIIYGVVLEQFDRL